MLLLKNNNANFKLFNQLQEELMKIKKIWD
jgi:hypothetical protein